MNERTNYKQENIDRQSKMLRGFVNKNEYEVMEYFKDRYVDKKYMGNEELDTLTAFSKFKKEFFAEDSMKKFTHDDLKKFMHGEINNALRARDYQRHDDMMAIGKKLGIDNPTAGNTQQFAGNNGMGKVGGNPLDF